MIEMWRFQKDITAPFSGQRFTIRRVRFIDYMAELGFAVSTADKLRSAVEELRTKTSDKDLEEKTTRFYLSHGVVEPKIWFGAEAECPPDEICFADIAADVGAIVSEIVEYSTAVAIQPEPQDDGVNVSN